MKILLVSSNDIILADERERETDCTHSGDAPLLREVP